MIGRGRSRHKEERRPLWKDFCALGFGQDFSSGSIKGRCSREVKVRLDCINAT